MPSRFDEVWTRGGIHACGHGEEAKEGDGGIRD